MAIVNGKMEVDVDGKIELREYVTLRLIGPPGRTHSTRNYPDLANDEECLWGVNLDIPLIAKIR